MNKKISFLNRTYSVTFVTGLSILLGSAAIYASLLPSRQNARAVIQDSELDVVSYASGVKVANAKLKNEGEMSMIETVLVNNSSQGIIALVFSCGEVSIVKHFVFREKMFEPGEAMTYAFPAQTEELVKTPKFNGKWRAVLSAVYYADHSGEGDNAILKSVKSRYEGYKQQLAQLMPILTLLNSSLKELDAKNLATEIERKSILIDGKNIDDRITPEYKAGAELALRDFHNKTGELLSLGQSKEARSSKLYQDKLTVTMEAFNRTLSRL